MASTHANLLKQKELSLQEFNSYRIGLIYPLGRRFIALQHRYGRRDVMSKRIIS